MICSIFRGCHCSGEELAIRNKKLKVAVVLAATAALAWAAWFALRRRGFDWTVFWSTLSRLNWLWLGAAVVLGLSTYVGRALRWAVLIRPVRRCPSMWGLISANAIGFTAITILGRPGEFVRPYLISVRERVSLSSQFAALLLERIFDLLMALILFGFALSRVRHSGVRVGPALAWVLAMGGWTAALVAASCLGVLLVVRHFSEPARVRLLAALSFLPARYYARAEDLVNAFVQGMECTRDGRDLLELIGYSVLEWALIAAGLVATFNAFGPQVHMGLADVLIFTGFLAFGAVIQIPGIGGGVQVVTVLVLTELFRKPLEVATSAAMVLWIINFVVIVPVGVLLALREGLQWGKLKDLKREVTP